MKFRIHLKDPDGVFDSVGLAAESSIKNISFGLTTQETEQLLDSRVGELAEFLTKYVSYGELVTIEFDTTTGTAQVVPVNEH